MTFFSIFIEATNHRNMASMTISVSPGGVSCCHISIKVTYYTINICVGLLQDDYTTMLRGGGGILPFPAVCMQVAWFQGIDIEKIFFVGDGQMERSNKPCILLQYKNIYKSETCFGQMM